MTDQVTALTSLLRLFAVLFSIAFIAGLFLIITSYVFDNHKTRERWRERMDDATYVKNRNGLKKNRKIGYITCIAVIGLVAVIAIVGSVFMKSSYVENKAEKVVELIQDDKLKEEINNYVQEMLDSGAIKEGQISTYIEGITQDPDLTLTREDGTIIGETKTAEPQTPVEGEASPAPVNNDSKSTQATTPAATSAPAKTPAPSEKTVESGSTLGVANKNEGSTTQRVLAAMTPEDLAFTKGIMEKVDINTALSLYRSDIPQCKAYIKSILSSAEIAQCLNIYGKYAYLL